MKKFVVTFLAFAVLAGAAVQIAPTAHAAVTTSGKFEDVPEHSPYASYIYDLKGQGVLVGKGDGQFDPTGTLKRSEFATMLAQAFRLPESGTATKFEDTKGHWSGRFVQACVTAGAVSGTSPTTFEPEALVRRQEAAAMVWRLLEKSGVAPTKQEISLTDSTADWATSAVKSVLGYNLHGVDAKDGAYRSGEVMTRQEAAALFATALKVKPKTAIIVNPTTNPTNLIDSGNGWQVAGNVTLAPSKIEGNKITNDQALSYLELYSQIKFQISQNDVTAIFPATGNVDHVWRVRDTSTTHEDFSDSKTITGKGITGIGIALADRRTGRLLMAGSLIKEDGTWQMRYFQD